jgi:CRP-like cAMP-binding protein
MPHTPPAAAPARPSSTAPPSAPQTAAQELPSNRLLTRLPSETRQRLVALATRVPLERDAELAQAGASSPWTYHPLSGLVSLQMMTEEGDTIEVAMIGREGLVGFPLAALNLPSPHTAVVMLRGEALRLKTDAIHAEFERITELQRAMLHHWQTLMSEMAQRSACHRFHTTRQRLARWLLEASDRIHNATIEMTQERLATALGIQRTGVTTASVSLQDLGAIKSRHGRITLLDRRRLQELSCECYRSVDRNVSP